MSLLDENVIDLIQTDSDTQVTRLIITDHLKWGGEFPDTEHLWKLQCKVNDYLKYIESGQLAQDYPDQKGYSIVLQVYGKYDRAEDAVKFYDQLRSALNNAGYSFEFILKS